MSQNRERRFAYLALPSWFYGGDPAKFLEDAEVRLKRAPARDMWRVETEESHKKRDAGMITSRRLAGPGGGADDLSTLNALPHEVPHDASLVAAPELERRLVRLRRTRNPIHGLEFVKLHVMTAATSNLAAVVKNDLEEIRSIPMEHDPDDKVFKNAGVHVIRRAPALLTRLKLPSVMCQIGQDRRAQAGDIAHLIGIDEGETAFASGTGLADGYYMLDAYLGPLLGALTPSVWCMTVPRAFGGVILFSLGQPVAGNSGSAEEGLHIIGVEGASVSQSVPRLSLTAGHQAISWWTTALDNLFSVLSDFAVFTDADEVYQPDLHMQTLMTVEQLFRRTSSALVSDRDTTARRVLMFSALDTVERLTSIQLQTLADPVKAQAALDRLRQTMTPEAAEVLLPVPSRAVAALNEISDGFFLHTRLGDPDLVLHLRDGSLSHTAVRAATAEYVKALRDATHGFGSKRAGARARTSALLAHHNGEVPHDLGLLAQLYLLDLLADPARLRAVLHERCVRDSQ